MLNLIFIQANIFTGSKEKTKAALFQFLETLIWESIEKNSRSEDSSNAHKNYVNILAGKNKRKYLRNLSIIVKRPRLG